MWHNLARAEPALQIPLDVVFREVQEGLRVSINRGTLIRACPHPSLRRGQGTVAREDGSEGVINQRCPARLEMCNEITKATDAAVRAELCSVSLMQ
jgi:hypothetical protein